jgi:hypothetical protein
VRPLRVQHRAMRAGKGGVDRLPHARTCGVEELRDGLRGESPQVTELSLSSEDGQAVHTGREESKEPIGEGKQVSLWEGRKGTRNAESRNDPEHSPMPGR